MGIPAGRPRNVYGTGVRVSLFLRRGNLVCSFPGVYLQGLENSRSRKTPSTSGHRSNGFSDPLQPGLERSRVYSGHVSTGWTVFLLGGAGEAMVVPDRDERIGDFAGVPGF